MPPARPDERDKALLALAAQLASEARRHADLRARLSAAESETMFGHFAGHVVHDMNNVLASLGNVLDLMAEGGTTLPAGELIAIGRRAVDRGSDLVRRLLDVARAGSDETECVSIAHIVHECRQALGCLLGRNISVQIQGADSLWQVYAEPALVQRVLFNLAANARDAMPGGGRFRITLENCTIAEAEAGAGAAVPQGAYVSLVIADTGTGMSKETLAKAGRSFFTTKARGKGTGLGLASAFELADACGGHVTIESTLGRGTTISIFLPRAGAFGRPGPAPRVAIDRTHHGGATILLIHGNDPASLSLGDLLRTLGYTIIEAESGGIALGMLGAAVAIDLVLIDSAAIAGEPGFQAALAAHRRPLPTICFGDTPAPPPARFGIDLWKPVPEPLLARAVLEQLGRLPAVLLTPSVLHAASRLRIRLANRAMLNAFDAWYGLSCSRGKLPSLQEIQPAGEELPESVIVMSALGTGAQPLFRVLRIGAALTARLGSDMTGSDMTGELLTAGDEASFGSMHIPYRRSLLGHAHFDYAIFSLGRFGKIRFQRLILPVSADAQSVTHLVALVDFDEQAGAMDQCVSGQTPTGAAGMAPQ